MCASLGAGTGTGIQARKRAVHLPVAALDAGMRARIRGRPVSRATTSGSQRSVRSWELAWQGAWCESMRFPRAPAAHGFSGAAARDPFIDGGLSSWKHGHRKTTIELPDRVRPKEDSPHGRRNRTNWQGRPLRTQRAPAGRARVRHGRAAGGAVHRGGGADPGHRDPGRGRGRSLPHVGGLRGAPRQRNDDDHAGGTGRPHRRGVSAPHGHLRRLHRGVRDGARGGRGRGCSLPWSQSRHCSSSRSRSGSRCCGESSPRPSPAP